MRHKFFVNHVLCALSGGFTLLLLLCTLALLIRQYLPGVLIFGVLTCVFFWICASYGSVIELSSQGIKRLTLGRVTWKRGWDEIGEVGICGTKLFGSHNRGHYGTLYFYFSNSVLSEDERFDMVLKWPPRKQCILMYRFDRLKWVQYYWSKPIVTYNAGEIMFDEIVDH